MSANLYVYATALLALTSFLCHLPLFSDALLLVSPHNFTVFTSMRLAAGTSESSVLIKR